MAEEAATWSKDPSTQVGVLLIDPISRSPLGNGYNGFPRGVNDDVPERWERPAKYLWCEHAERNAIYNAAKLGIRCGGAWLYMNFAPTPCSDCARAIIQSGIVKVIGPNRPFSGVGAGVHYHLSESATMLHEAGVEVLAVEMA